MRSGWARNRSNFRPSSAQATAKGLISDPPGRGAGHGDEACASHPSIGEFRISQVGFVHYDYRTTLYRLYSQTVVRCYMRCSSKYWSLSFIVYTLVSVHGGW